MISSGPQSARRVMDNGGNDYYSINNSAYQAKNNPEGSAIQKPMSEKSSSEIKGQRYDS